MTASPQRITSDPVLVVTKLRVAFGDVVAVDDVSLSLYSGDLIAVTGPSGAGKTTLINAIAGLIADRAAGSVTINLQALEQADQGHRLGVVTIPQGNGLVRVLTALENVALPLLADAHHGDGVRTAAIAAMRAVGIDTAADQLVEELSGGQQQRVAIARALAQPFQVLLADEPTSELDAGNRANVMRLLRARSDEGAAIIMATHDQSTADLCDAQLTLSDGHPEWTRDSRDS